MGLILALDLSSKTGFCGGYTKPQWGVWRLPREGEAGRILATLRNQILDTLEAGGGRFTDLVVEQTLPAHRQTHAKTAVQQTDLAAVAKIVAYDEGLAFHEKPVSSVRAKFLGKGWGKVTKKEKEAGRIVQEMQRRGYRVFDDNAADAIVLFEWAKMTGIGQ